MMILSVRRSVTTSEARFSQYLLQSFNKNKKLTIFMKETPPLQMMGMPDFIEKEKKILGKNAQKIFQ